MTDDNGRAPVAVANAPVSYGAFELTVGQVPGVPDGASVLSQVAAAGYAGIDLGPVGYLGRGDELGEALARPTLADSGSKRRAMLPARSVRDHSLGFDADGWKRFAAGLAGVIARCRDRGYEPTFHPETGTHVEAPWEIERVLEVSDIGLCLETGHMLLGGGDPVTMLRDLGDRVNHVHLKDARLAVMSEIVSDQAPVTEIWSREAFCALGGGDLDVDAVLAGLRTISFGGWLVVEQDILPRSADRFARAAKEQRHNRAFLAERGL
jgi:inosose dehydratase